MINKVPLKSKDEKTVVDAETLKEWIVSGLIEEDPYSKPFSKNMEKITEEIEAINKKMKEVPKLEFRDPQGNLLLEEEADAERQAIYEVYGDERREADNRLKKQEDALKKHTEWRRRMGIDISKGEIEEKSETATWHVRFYGTKDAGANNIVRVQ